MPLLFGEHDRHLARIEQRLGVRLASRGNRLAIEGPHSSSEAARGALTWLYERLRRGQTRWVGDLSPKERQAYALADNKLALSAGRDAVLLALEFHELIDAGLRWI